ncbi:PREDICTED: uncharacterized protein LOC109586649 [Amphimedon queenslandica]|uniref:Uncharacterized protein n=1 Tax=Amphimedon queenslandica TaxID=400682 RepID=A0A1X7TPP2_AMPQE|nr:PREDICTED: uncharacterized protein LOC109586649 [Amphimedon queenslandica]XP_019858410.1 PREDICTED: uncharacterized protein LOC109586649 [Amphimedon queenslandica]|eukprot:XP_019858409.1 PREDICTED: uncharacterized protein LOC109586649 [Amphimedon queenslandica]
MHIVMSELSRAMVGGVSSVVSSFLLKRKGFFVEMSSRSSRCWISFLDSGVGRVIDKGREEFMNLKDFAEQKLLKWRVNAILSNRGWCFLIALDLADRVIDKLEYCVVSTGDRADEFIDHLCNELTDHR